MIDKETWKIGAGQDKMEKLIKYHMYVQYHKKHPKKKLYQVTIKQSSFFFMNDGI